MGTLGESALDNEYAEAGAINYGDWMGGFYRNGFAVVKGCIPEEKAKHYQSKALDWRQSFNLGFDPKDESIWTKAHLPEGFKEECTLAIRSHMGSSCGMHAHKFHSQEFRKNFIRLTHPCTPCSLESNILYIRL